MEATKIRSTSKYPTTLIVKGLNPMGIEIAKRLIEQEGYVIIIDSVSDTNVDFLSEIKDKSLLTVLDIAAITGIENDLRRLDYVFYFEHDTSSFIKEISSQEFLQKSNYLDTILDLTVKFKAKFLLTTSIKAHQLLIENSSLDINSGFEPIPKYSETEAQRYSENLVSEYQSKLDLDARTVRVGELLGKGMNPSSGSMYMNLIVNAIEGKPLEIQGDGLESDFYIHYIDAARGLIHAMFSMTTRGKIFSLSIPEEISILSIAYKIADIEQNAGEIKFVEYNSPLPPLRLYKPAPNLDTTGWNHKITINRAISQSIEYIKEISRVDTVKEIDESRGEFKDISPESENVHGALARLISERKKQEKTRMGSVVLANEDLRNKMNGEQDLKKKLSKSTFWLFEGIKQQFSFLKNITVKEFIFSMILLAIFGLIYIFVMSPILNIGTNLFHLNNNIQGISTDVNNQDYINTSLRLNESSKNIESIQNRISELNFIFSLTGNLQNYSKIQNSLETQKDFVEGLALTYESLVPLYSYLDSHNYELIPKLSDELSLLDVEQINDQTNITEIAAQESSLKLGVEKLKLSSLNISDSLNVYPPNIKNLFSNELSNLTSTLSDIFALEENYSYIPTMLGKDRKISYLFMIEDSTRYTPGGGAFSGYILMSIENGLVTKIEVNSIDKLENKTLSIRSLELSEINLVSTQSFTRENVTFGDLSMLKDKDLRSILTKKYFESIFSEKIDVLGWVNLNTLDNLLENNEIMIDQVQVTSDEYLNSIATLAGTDASTQRRDRVILQIFSQILVQSNTNKKVVELLSGLKNPISEKDIEFYTNDLELKSFFSKFEDEVSDDYIEFGMTSNGEATNTKPKLTITGDITVKSNGSTVKNLRLVTNGVGNLESAWICLPAGSKNFSTPNFDPNLYSRNFSSTQACNIFLPDENNSFPLRFETIGFENNDNSIYNYSLMLLKPVGIETEYEIRFIFETTTQVSSEKDPTIARINDFTFSSNQFTDNIIFNFFEDGQ